MNKKLFIFLAVIGALIVTLYFSCKHLITLDIIRAQQELFLSFVNAHYVPSVLLFIVLYALIVMSSLPLAALATVLGGFLFRFIAGGVYSFIGAMIGAILSFLMFRYLFGQRIQARYKERLATFNTNIERYGSRYMIMIHLLVVVPFFIVNVVAAMTTMSLWTFTWTTAVGVAPSLFLYAYAGQELATINSLSDICSWPVLGVLGAFIGIGLLSIAIDMCKKK